MFRGCLIVFKAIRRWLTIRGGPILVNYLAMELELLRNKRVMELGRSPSHPPQGANQHPPHRLRPRLTQKSCQYAGPRPESSRTWRRVSPFRPPLQNDAWR